MPVCTFVNRKQAHTRLGIWTLPVALFGVDAAHFIEPPFHFVGLVICQVVGPFGLQLQGDIGLWWHPPPGQRLPIGRFGREPPEQFGHPVHRTNLSMKKRAGRNEPQAVHRGE